jgi:hypothetical protein
VFVLNSKSVYSGWNPAERGTTLDKVGNVSMKIKVRIQTLMKKCFSMLKNISMCDKWAFYLEMNVNFK